MADQEEKNVFPKISLKPGDQPTQPEEKVEAEATVLPKPKEGEKMPIGPQKINLGEITGEKESVLGAPPPKEAGVKVEAKEIGKKGEKEVIPDLFADKKEKKESQVIKSVVEKGEKTSILGAKPKLSGAQLGFKEKAYPVGSFLMKLFVIILAVSFVFFYSQLKPGFNAFGLLGENPVTKLNRFDQSVVAEQTALNLTNYKAAKLHFDVFNNAADTYFAKRALLGSLYTPKNVLPQLEQDTAVLKTEMIDELKEIQAIVVRPIYPAILQQISTAPELEQEFGLALKQSANEERQDLRTSLAAQPVELTREINDLDTALNIFNNKQLLNQFKGLIVDDANDATFSTIQELYSKNAQSTFALVSTVKVERDIWSDLVRKLESVTNSVDPLFGTQFKSNIEYNSYTMDESRMEMTISGSTLTRNAQNFTLIANLVDTLEKSPHFQDVQTRSFSKTTATDGGEFTANFQISLIIQEGEDPRDTVVTIN